MTCSACFLLCEMCFCGFFVRAILSGWLQYKLQHVCFVQTVFALNIYSIYFLFVAHIYQYRCLIVNTRRLTKKPVLVQIVQMKNIQSSPKTFLITKVTLFEIFTHAKENMVVTSKTFFKLQFRLIFFNLTHRTLESSVVSFSGFYGTYIRQYLLTH